MSGWWSVTSGTYFQRGQMGTQLVIIQAVGGVDLCCLNETLLMALAVLIVLHSCMLQL